MSSETNTKMGSSYPESVSFPNTRIKSTKPLEMGSRVFRFQPVRSDVLLKQLLEADEDSPKLEKTPKHKTSQIISQSRKCLNSNMSSDEDETNKNILDKTFIEDDSSPNNKYLVPGVSWLNSPPNRKPLKIIAKPVPSTPMTNMINKLSIRDQPSARKVPRTVSLDRKDEEKVPQTPVTNNIFKTPSCKNSRILPNCSTAQKLHASERSVLSVPNNQLLSARKRQFEATTPKLHMQPKINCGTPRQSSVIHAAVNRNFNTPRPTLPSATNNEKIISNSVKKTDAVLREKNFNVIGLERQKSNEIITNEEKQPLGKNMHSGELKQISNKQSDNNGIKQSLTKTSGFINDQQLNEIKQSNNNELKHSAIKRSNFNDEKQLQNKPSNSKEIKQSHTNEEKQLPVKHANNSEEKDLPIKQSNSNELKQLVVKQSNSSELKQPQQKQSHNNEEKQIPNKQMNIQISIPIKNLQESTFQQLKVRGKDYIVINKIGEGGSGQVYRCLEQDTLQDRAIKVVNLNVDPATVISYINEVKMLKDLQGNDRVIRMYDYEQVNQNLFVVMEKGDVDFSIFLRNITTESQIQTHVIVCYWIEMLKCVREIHKKGIIHSDLKPSNFLIVGGRLKLIDFGIASRLTSDMTSVIKNVTVGTFNYISPEALLDSRECPTDEKPQLRISYKSDVWSLGCILYQMVYKRTPFQSVGSIWAKFAVITDRNHKIDYKQIPGVHLYLIDMIKKCLLYDMRSRPTVEELLNMYYSGNYC